MDMQVTELDNGITEVALAGRLDMEGSGKIENAFTIATATDEAPVLVDLSRVDFIASIGMRLLVMNAKALQRRGGKMVLLNAQPLVGEALNVAGIDLLIPLFTDRSAAEAELLATVS
jgi:anti-anti-sigma factor